MTDAEPPDADLPAAELPADELPADDLPADERDDDVAGLTGSDDDEGGAGADSSAGAGAAAATEAGEGLPEAATRRLAASSWSSGLSVTDFAACIELGLEPVGLVQGYAVMQWSNYLAGPYGTRFPGGLGGGWWPSGDRRGRYVEEWRCPHGFVSSEHRIYGANFEQDWVEDGWANGWQLARDRMIEEATALGAYGVIGVADDVHPLVGTSTLEFRMTGTAVVVPDAARPPSPFTTYLAGQRLTKLLEAGYVPVAVAATLSSVSMIGYCMTNYQLAGTVAATWSGLAPGGVGPIPQVNRAQLAARHLARERIRRQLRGDLLHGVTVRQTEREVGEGDLVLECWLRGNRVRRFKEFDPLADPQPVVRLR